ncbi:hypothetical protein C8R44DRAFT_104367 [Mycena epipterygia]|nr:hypothetical protein C8R44DRAFT_104367 [Mycena epipterygia]
MSNSDRRTRLDKLDQEIPQLRLRLKQLERERSEIFSSLTFPVLTLPVEVTSEIFIHCLPTTPSAPRSSDAPLLLARVCRPWRNIALFTPRLWSTFSFPVNTPESQQARDYFINGWLSRSSNHGLFIRLYAMYEPGEDDEAEAPARARPGSIKTCLELFTKHSFRWRSVELCLKLSVLQNLPQATFPQLEHLTIGCWAQDDRDFRSSYLDFSAAPRLRSVKMLLDSVGDVDMRLVSLPWTQLTSFTGKEFCVNECFLF